MPDGRTHQRLNVLVFLVFLLFYFQPRWAHREPRRLRVFPSFFHCSLEWHIMDGDREAEIMNDVESTMAAPFVAEPFDAAPFEAAPFEAAPFEAASYVAEPFVVAPFEAEPFEAAPFEAAHLSMLDRHFLRLRSNACIITSKQGTGYRRFIFSVTPLN